MEGLPGYWQRKRLRYISSRPIRNGLGEAANSDDPEHPRYIRITDIAGPRQLRSDTFRSLPPEVASEALVHENDILISAAGATYGKSFFAQELTGEACFAGYVVRLSLVSDVDPSFLAYWTESRDYWAQVDANVIQATIQNFSAAKVRHLNAPLPSLNTQRRIARFLDEKTARIDGLIGKKRMLLDRLAEKRQALITRAVTKGLNPDAPMKPSGIDWLGDIPAHWEVKRLKYIASDPLSYGANAAAEYDEPEWPRFVRITDVDELGRLRDETFRSLPPEVAQGFILQPNDILMARSGATVGKSFIYDISWGEACYAGYLIRARIKKEHDARFFYAFLNSASYWEWVRSTFIQSTIQNISADRYASLQIPHPSDNHEQKKIADFIENSCAQIDSQWKLVARSLKRLDEYRAAMITAAVTGRLAELR